MHACTHAQVLRDGLHQRRWAVLAPAGQPPSAREPRAVLQRWGGAGPGVFAFVRRAVSRSQGTYHVWVRVCVCSCARMCVVLQRRGGVGPGVFALVRLALPRSQGTYHVWVRACGWWDWSICTCAGCSIATSRCACGTVCQCLQFHHAYHAQHMQRTREGGCFVHCT